MKNKGSLILAASLAISGIVLASIVPIIVYKNYTKTDFIDPKLDEQKLMKNQIWNLSSMNNIDDELASSLKQNILLAISENYPEYSPDDILLNFYYGSSKDETKIPIEFKSENYQTILYFNVEISSRNNSFKKTTIDFDYRPNLPKEEGMGGFRTLYINKNIKISNWESYFNCLNTSLSSDSIRNYFNDEWEGMGIKPDGFMNDNNYEYIKFSNEEIKNISNNFTFKDSEIKDLSFIDKLPLEQKTNLFKTNEKAIALKEYFWKIKSKTGENAIENNYKILGLDQISQNFYFDQNDINLKDKQIKTYNSKFIKIFIDNIYNKTGILLKSSDLAITYADGWDANSRTVYGGDTYFKEILENNSKIWIEFKLLKANLLIDMSTEPGFSINILEQGEKYNEKNIKYINSTWLSLIYNSFCSFLC